MRRSSSSSRSWSSAFQKVFRRRSSESKGKQPALDDEFEIGEHKDGFYKYSQEVEEENWRLESQTVKTVFRTRSSQAKGKQPAMDDEIKTGEHKNGLYKYSQEMLEEGDRRQEPRTMRASDSTEASYASAVSGRDILSRPFAKQIWGKETNTKSADATHRNSHSPLHHRLV